MGNVNPGRGWMMVRADWLTPNQITAAIKRGDFYNSTGVTLTPLDVTDAGISLGIEAEAGVEYMVEFVGTLQDADLAATTSNSETHEHEGSLDHQHQTIHRFSGDIGKALKTVNGSKAEYQVQGNEIYLRARITSSKLPPNSYAESDPEMAWTQPLVVVKVSDIS